MIACEDIRATESWISHIHGVTALVELRSSDDWKRTTNQRVFLQVCYTAVCPIRSGFLLNADLIVPQAMGSLIKKTRVSQPIAEFVQSSPAFQSDMELVPASRLFRIICGFAQLHASVTRNEVTNPVEIISTAIGIDNDLSSWVSDLPPLWRYRTFTWDTARYFYGDYYHIYQSSWHACIWNYYRACRVLVHSILLHNLSTLALPVSLARPALVSAYCSQRAKSQTLLSRIPLDICASIPYQLGLHEREKNDYLSIPKPSGVFSLLGILQVLVSLVDASLGSNGWVSKTFELMGRELGIGQALAIGRTS